MPEFRMAVLGLCCAEMERGASGVGKSSLCTRFVHPDVDDWKELGCDHSHWLSQADVQEREINGDHFLYFGVGRRDHYPMRSEGLVWKENPGLSIHVVEHSKFLDDSTGRPFPSFEAYEKRAAGTWVPSKNMGKVAYSCRARLGEGSIGGQETLMKQKQYPREFSNFKGSAKGAGVQGFLFVMDPTTSRACREQQWLLWEKCWSNIPSKCKKDSCAIVLTKCDQLQHAQALNKRFPVVQHFKDGKCLFRDESDKMAVRSGKFSIPVFFTSAERRIGVDLPFVYIAHRTLGLSGRPLGPVKWDVACEMRRKLDKLSLAAAVGFLNDYIRSTFQEWPKSVESLVDLYGHTAMDMCRSNHGSKECHALFRSRLMSLIADRAIRDVTGDGEVSSRVAGQRRIREKALEMIRNHPDLGDMISSDLDTNLTDCSRLYNNLGRLRKSFRKINAGQGRERRQRRAPSQEESAPLLASAASPGGSSLAAAGDGGGEGEEEEEVDDCQVVTEWFSDVNCQSTGKRVSYEEWVVGLKNADTQLQKLIDVLHDGDEEPEATSPGARPLLPLPTDDSPVALSPLGSLLASRDGAADSFIESFTALAPVQNGCINKSPPPCIADSRPAGSVPGNGRPVGSVPGNGRPAGSVPGNGRSADYLAQPYLYPVDYVKSPPRQWKATAGHSLDRAASDEAEFSDEHDPSPYAVGFGDGNSPPCPPAQSGNMMHMRPLPPTPDALAMCSSSSAPTSPATRGRLATSPLLSVPDPGGSARKCRAPSPQSARRLPCPTGSYKPVSRH